MHSSIVYIFQHILMEAEFIATALLGINCIQKAPVLKMQEGTSYYEAKCNVMHNSWKPVPQFIVSVWKTHVDLSLNNQHDYISI